MAMLSYWPYSGFQVFCGRRIFLQDETAIENLARFILRGFFSQEWMQYLAEPSKVVYQAKEGIKEKVFDALERMAAMCFHLPDKREQMFRYKKLCTTIKANSSNGNPHFNLKPTVVCL